MSENIEEIKRIIKSNTNRNNYTKAVHMRICDDELFRLNELINLIGGDLTIHKCIEYLKENSTKLNGSQIDELNELTKHWNCLHGQPE